MSENTQVRQALWDAYFRADTGDFVLVADVGVTS